MITIKDVEHVAKLARLELTEEEKEKFTKQLGDVLKHVDAKRHFKVHSARLCRKAGRKLGKAHKVYMLADIFDVL